MSLSDDIRRALANSGEPMNGRELCDAMGEEDKAERERICSNASAMVKKRSGIERDELGRYMLIPGWRKWQRNSGDSHDDAGADDAAAVQEKLKATTHVEIKADAVTSEQVKALQSVAATSGHIVLAPGIGKAEPSEADDKIHALAIQTRAAKRKFESMQGPPDADQPAATTTANQVAERISAYLRGEADHNLVTLLREAREEIMQLDCAARMALASAEELTSRLREATK